ncbi:hypothetical protein [Mesorhizobium sp. 98Argb]
MPDDCRLELYNSKMLMNPFDKNLLGTGIAAQRSRQELTVVSIGSSRAEQAIKAAPTVPAKTRGTREQLPSYPSRPRRSMVLQTRSPLVRHAFPGPPRPTRLSLSPSLRQPFFFDLSALLCDAISSWDRPELTLAKIITVRHPPASIADRVSVADRFEGPGAEVA